MSQPTGGQEPVRSRSAPVFVGTRPQQPDNLADILERVLDKGIVIVGDIQVRLLDIELLTIKIRLMVASVDRAREMGINWWEGDPFISTRDPGALEDGGRSQSSQIEQGKEGSDRQDGDAASRASQRPAAEERPT